MSKTTDTDIQATVEHVAELAKLKLPQESFETFGTKARAVISYVEQLGELNTKDIEPTSHATGITSSLREDSPTAFEASCEILAAAPRHDGPFFQVPKVIEGEEP